MGKVNPSLLAQQPRRGPSRSAAFKGRYQVDSGKGGFKRSSTAFRDPKDTLRLMTPQLKKRGHEFLIKARQNFKRKGMSDKITQDMKKRARSLQAHEQTAESQRMLDHPNESLQSLGVERNHINANGQVATQLTAFTSFQLHAKPTEKPLVETRYQSFVEAHGVPQLQAKQLASDFTSMTSLIETAPDVASKQRIAENLLVSQTTAIADQSENLRFGRSQHKPRPDLKIVIPDRPTFGSNQDVGSHWDGNRTPKGSLTPRSKQIFDGIHRAETEGIFPPGMATASTTRPIRIEDDTAFGSLHQTGK